MSYSLSWPPAEKAAAGSGEGPLRLRGPSACSSKLLVVAVALAVTVGAALAASAEPSLSQPRHTLLERGDVLSTFAAGVEAYIYGYPLVLLGVTARLSTNVPNSASMLGRAPRNQFAHVRTLPDPSYTDVVMPNLNTLYSAAWLDLSAEPVVLHIPDLGDR